MKLSTSAQGKDRCLALLFYKYMCNSDIDVIFIPELLSCLGGSVVRAPAR